MSTLISHVQLTVDPREYYAHIFEDAQWPSAQSEARVLCPFHDEKTPSMSLNGESGAWFCHGCEEGGKSIISFHSRYYGENHPDSAEGIFHEFIHPIIDPKAIRRWHRRIHDTPTALRYTLGRRVSAEAIDHLAVGWDGERITFPVQNEFGMWVNVKRYDPLAKKRGSPKMLNYKRRDESRSYGSPPMLWPLASLIAADESEPVFVCEGEWDTAVLLSMGLLAVTSTGGCKTWPAQYNELFRNKHVIIVYDNDQDGTKYDRKVIRSLLRIARSIRRIRIPKKYGKDVSDWVNGAPRMRKAAGWIREVERAEDIVENPGQLVERTDDIIRVPLQQASRAEMFERNIAVDALVTGKGVTPYLLPKKWRVMCDKTCDDCPLTESGKDFREVELSPLDAAALKMTDASEQSRNALMLAMSGMHPKPTCHAKIEIVESFNMEQLLLIPTLDSEDGRYVVCPSYFAGHGLHPNRAYRFIGTTVPNPKNQHATHLFTQAAPIQGHVETFELTPALKRDLRKFRPGRHSLIGHFHRLAEWQSRNVTKILERPDLHIAVDLVFHSVAAFEFNGEFVNRGMLDVLVMGDTRCGKGYVTERLTKYYGVGEVASGENCTFAGLVGGVQQNGKQWFVTWGLVPLNHGRLVVIDEASSLTEAEIGHMSRVRSEGVAEITKIVREQTQANTRLIWLSNPRSGRPILSYNTGVEAIKELVGANEDVSRFDFAMTVATNEVPSEIINAPAPKELVDEDKFPRELCRSLIMWAWSRKPDQIQFTAEATSAIIAKAIEFGHRYSSQIPLVQSENIRIKIAKIAAAVAARTFSTDETCEKVVIEREHVEFACEFLSMIYGKPSMAYDLFSRASIAMSTIADPDALAHAFGAMGDDRDAVLRGIMQLTLVTTETLTDYVGDPFTAKALISDLVKLNCLKRAERGLGYYKNPAFNEWLKAHNPERTEHGRTGNADRKVRGRRRGRRAVRGG